MLINITEEHIQRGCPGKAYGCPIALAMTESLKKPIGIGVDVWWEKILQLADGNVPILNRPVRHLLPPEAIAFVRAFDDGEEVGPISFDISE